MPSACLIMPARLGVLNVNRRFLMEYVNLISLQLIYARKILLNDENTILHYSCSVA